LRKDSQANADPFGDGNKKSSGKRNGNCKCDSKDEMQGFFAALRMTA
jgi:hypothetical protein